MHNIRNHEMYECMNAIHTINESDSWTNAFVEIGFVCKGNVCICKYGKQINYSGEYYACIHGHYNESVKKKKERMENRHKQWRKQAEEIGQNASILAGGDGSRKQRNGETIAAYGWGVYGIGEHSVEY